jgi:hypothetical protein
VWQEIGSLLKCSELLLSDAYRPRGTEFWPTDVSGTAGRPDWWMPNAAMFAFTHRKDERVSILVSVVLGDRHDTGRLRTPLASASLLFNRIGVLDRPTAKGGYHMYFVPLCDASFVPDGSVQEVDAATVDVTGLYKIDSVHCVALPLTRLSSPDDIRTLLLAPVLQAADSLLTGERA